MSIWLTGDIHGDIDINRLSFQYFPEGKNLTKDDYVIILGDFGVLWKNEPDKTEKYWLSWLDERPFTTLFISGNHENYFRLNNLEQVEKFNGVVGKVNESVYHLKNGYVYTIENKTFFCMGGATSIDKHLRVENLSWWKEELPTVTETNFALEQLDKYKDGVNYVLTHTAPDWIIRTYIDEHSAFSKSAPDCLTNFLNHIWDVGIFEAWFCGHFHLNLSMVNNEFNVLYHKFYKIGEENE